MLWKCFDIFFADDEFVNSIILGCVKNQFFIGGVVAIILDNLIPGK